MDHTVKAFDDEIAELEGRVAELGDATEKLATAANAPLTNGERADPETLKTEHMKICELERTCAEFALVLIARRQPVACDLRTIVAALRIADDYKRIADLAIAIARRAGVAKSLSDLPSLNKAYGDLQSLIAEQLKSVRIAQRDRDEALCRAVWEMDRVVDEAYGQTFAAAVHMLALTPQTMLAVVDVLFCAKNLERIADHIATIADMVFFAKTGHRISPPAQGPGSVHEVVASAA
jgi:phosphate transport system protein